MGVLKDRGDLRSDGVGSAWAVAVLSFHDAPLVVHAARARSGLEVNLLVEVLAHIPDVHVARLLVEAEPPGVSQPKRPDLAKNLGISSKRVRRGDPIGISGVYIDSEDFTQE